MSVGARAPANACPHHLVFVSFFVLFFVYFVYKYSQLNLPIIFDDETLRFTVEERNPFQAQDILVYVVCVVVEVIEPLHTLA